MGKGDIHRFEFRERRDETTGSRVLRLSPPGANCCRIYFYQKCFTEDGSRLLFCSDLDGEMNLYLLDLGSREATQLTEGPGVNCLGAYLAPDDRRVFYVEDRRRLVELDLEGFRARTVYEVPEPWRAYGTWGPSSDGSRLAALVMHGEDQVSGGAGWDRFRRQYEARPRMRLLDLDARRGEAAVVLEERRFLGHPMFRPRDDSTMAFCHEGPHDLVDSRMWLVGRDGSRLRRVKEQSEGESCTHEFFLPDGSRLVYVGYERGRAERSIWAADPDSLENEKLMPMPPCAHLMSDSSGRFLAGDGAGQLGDLADKAGHALEPDPFIYLFDLAERSSRKVCVHGSSWAEFRGNTQATHPHPSFSPDGGRLLFTSDREGELAIFLAELS